MKIKRPMKAATVEEDQLEDLKFPLLVSPKLDGFRCLKLGGKALSLSFKPIANDFTRETIEKYLPVGLDGELMLRDESATFNKISSVFRRYKGEPDFVFWVFDFVTNKPFKERLQKASAVVSESESNRVRIVPHTYVNSVEELLDYEQKCLEEGYEGVMLRDPESPYKQGRSTLKQGWLMKLKRFKDSEAEVIGFIEQYHNENSLEKNEIGLSKRSHKKEGMVPANTLGAFKVRDVYSGVEFELSTGEGLTHSLRKEIWDNQDSYLGEIVKYKYQEHGTKDRPRIPIWLGFRAKEDMS